MSHTFTFRRCAAVLGVLAIIGGASGITACSEGFGERFLPHPPEENTATDATDGPESSDRHGYSDEGEHRPPRALRPDRRGGDRSEPPGETERTEHPPHDAPHAAGDDPPTVDESVTLHPDGKELSLTRGGSTLSFGETATVATSADDGRLFVWDITVYDKVVRSPDQVRLSDPSESHGVDHYVCYAYDVVFVGVDDRNAEDPSVLRGAPDTARTAVPAPGTVPVAADRSGTTRLRGGEDDNCGIPVSNRVPLSEKDLVRGHAYARGTVAAVTEPAESAPTAPPAGVRFDGDPLTSSGDHGRPAPPLPVFWL
ncbi:hypothetical protein [Corynebacterium glyciniphilum]|uniref:hypothetical protein n=1 Tax=Corynebacterium glyciniphilum TaxID=1404244 RepID=UPI0011AB7A96|nr:hypothetical protein [Corynebacterium glyciniphilum]